jgi:heme-degrading monooxygenase HmoA
MTTTIDPQQRIAAPPIGAHDGSVTLVNCFVVAADRDEAFSALWSEASAYFRKQPGYVSLRLHRALSPASDYRYINVANWASSEQFAAAHDTEEFRRLVGQPAWREFPSRPALYEVVVAHNAAVADRS